MRHIRRLLDERMFGGIRSLAERIIKDHAAWEKAKRAGGRDHVQAKCARLLEKHGQALTMAVGMLGQQMGPAGAGMVSMLASPNAVAGLAAQLLCGKASGSEAEEAALRAKIRELDSLIANLPEYGDESLYDLQQDSALVELLSRVSEIEESLNNGVEPGPIGRALDFVGG